MYDHVGQVKAYLKKLSSDVPNLFLVSVDGKCVGTHKIFMKLFSPVLSDLVTQTESVVHVSVPASGHVLHHLVSILTKGFTLSSDLEELNSVTEVAEIIVPDIFHLQVDESKLGREKAWDTFGESVASENIEDFQFENLEHKINDITNDIIVNSLPAGDWKDFACGQCLRSFASRSQLSLHEEVAHGRECGRGGRPRKKITESYRGKRLIKAVMKQQQREVKEVKRRAWEIELSKGPNGNSMALEEVGISGSPLIQNSELNKGRLNKQKQNQERKSLWEKGLCRGPDGKVVTFQEVGKFGSSGNIESVCTDCGKVFNSKKELKNHEMLHTGEKPYVCGVCSKTFVSRGGLGSHMKTTSCRLAK